MSYPSFRKRPFQAKLHIHIVTKQKV